MEKLLEIVLFIISMCSMAFAQAYIAHFAISVFFKKVCTKKQLFLAFLISLPLSFMSVFFIYFADNLNILKSIIGIVGLALVPLVIYKSNIVHTIVVTVSGTFIFYIFDIIMVVIISVFFRNITDINNIVENKPIYYLVTIITNLLGISILKVISLLVNKKIYKLTNWINKNIDYKIILSQGIIIIISLTPSMFLLFSNYYDYALVFLLINTFQLIVVSLFSFFYMKKRILFKDTELELENTKLHNQALSTINENIRGFKHDMGNMVQSINGYLSVGNIDGVKTYCKNLLHGFNDINLLSILSPKIINDPAIYGIVVSKMLYARENNLTLSLDIGLDVSQINFPSFELSRIIGILLDNAIEASLESTDRKLKLEMYHDENRNCDIIIIGNSVKDANKIDVIKMFEKNYSTKENPSGFGLYEVLKFLNKFNKGDIVPNIDYETNFFTQTLTFDR